MFHVTVSRGLIAVASIAMLASCAGRAIGDIVYFDNSAAQFAWDESYYLGGFHHGTSLDITLPPTQSGEATPYSLQSYSEVFFTSGQLVTTSLTPDAPNVSIARGPHTLVNSPGPYSGFVDPAVAYSAQALIGPTVPNGSWGVDADVDWRSLTLDISLIGGHAFVGVLLQLPDGTHYGFIDLVDNGYNHNPSFTPIGWGWETTPDVPIPAGAVPVPASLVCLAATAMCVRRRRRA